MDSINKQIYRFKQYHEQNTTIYTYFDINDGSIFENVTYC